MEQHSPVWETLCLSNCACLSDIGEGVDFFGRLGGGTEVVASGRGAVLGFLLMGVFVGEGFTTGLEVDF